MFALAIGLQLGCGLGEGLPVGDGLALGDGLGLGLGVTPRTPDTLEFVVAVPSACVTVAAILTNNTLIITTTIGIKSGCRARRIGGELFGCGLSS
jgi:hypothetical protein